MSDKHSKEVRDALDRLRELLGARRLLLVVETGNQPDDDDELSGAIYESGPDRLPIEVIQRITEVLAEEWILERESRLSDEDILALQEGVFGEDPQ